MGLIYDQEKENREFWPVSKDAIDLAGNIAEYMENLNNILDVYFESMGFAGEIGDYCSGREYLGLYLSVAEVLGTVQEWPLKMEFEIHCS